MNQLQTPQRGEKPPSLDGGSSQKISSKIFNNFLRRTDIFIKKKLLNENDLASNKETVYKMMADFLQSRIRRIFDPPEKVLSLLNISEGMVIADIGCGPGVYSVEIAKRVGNSGLVYAIDSSEYMINRAKLSVSAEKLNNVRFIKTDASDLSMIPTGSVDLAIFIYSFHHIDKKIDAIREALRIIKPNGRIFILDPIYQRFFFHGLKDHEVREIIDTFGNEARFSVSRKLWQILIFINKK